MGCAAIATDRPNILLVLSDDLTWHDIGCYGNKEVNTPNIDRLATEGIRFEYCFNSAPTCAPTRMSLYTGIHPVRNGAHPNHSVVYPTIKSIPHYLRRLGYRVSLLGKRHYQPEEQFPFEWLGGVHHDPGPDKLENDLDLSRVEETISRDDHPWCLVVASNQAHTPWNRGDASQFDAGTLTLPAYLIDTPETREAMTRYYAEISYLDDQVGQCLQMLKRSGQEDDTLVIYLSEQGSYFPHCKWTCYDSGLRSAAIFRYPGVIEAGVVTEAIMQYVDIAPTLLEFAGGDPDSEDFDGRSLVPVLTGKADTHHEYAYGVQTSRGIHYGPEAYGIRTVRDKRFRLVWNVNSENRFQNSVTTKFEPYFSWGRKGVAGDFSALEQFYRYQKRPEFELYDLETDPYEMNNLAGAPDMDRHFGRLKQTLDAWMAQQGDRGAETEWDALSRQNLLPGH